MKLINIGCGSRFHPDWINLDLNPQSQSVKRCDIVNGLPFLSDTCDVVYHAHLLEHFSRERAVVLLKECFRILRPKGILRLAVPDLEAILRLYIKALERSIEGDIVWEKNYEWLLLEMYDQAVREKPGGEMAAFLTEKFVSNRDFVLSRLGIDGKKMMDKQVQNMDMDRGCPDLYLKKSLFGSIFKILRGHAKLREVLIRILLGKEYDLLQLGRFRRSGEIHLWMYDKYSLAKALKGAGFQDPVQMKASESRIPDWHSFNLEVGTDGSVYKPDSLFMEAIKP